LSGLPCRRLGLGRPDDDTSSIVAIAALTDTKPSLAYSVDHVSSCLVTDPGRAAPPADSLGREELREASLTGVRWSSLTRLIAEVFAFAGSVVLAHLIVPGEFGFAAVALGIAAIVPAVAGSSFSVPLVQMKTVDRAHFEAAMVLSIVTGAALTLVTIFVVAPLAIQPIFGSRIAYLLQLVSPTFALACIGIVPNAQLQRSLRFRRLSEIELATIVTSPTASISLAATTNLSAEAIVLGSVIAATVATLLTVASVPPVRFGWRSAYGRDIASVGFSAALTTTVVMLSRNIHYAILGARLPAHDVGLFWRAYQLGVGYQAKVGAITTRLAFPLFSRSSDLDQMRHLRGRILEVQSVILFPMLGALIVVAPELVPLVYGSEWQDAAAPVQFLALAGMATIAASAGLALTFAAGRGRPLFYFSVVQLAGFVAVVVFCSSYGLRSVAIGIAAYQILFVAAQFVYLESRAVGIPLRETWQALVPASVATGAALGVAYPAVRVFMSDSGDGASILAGCALAIGLSAVVLRVGFPSRWFTIIRLLAALVARGKTRTPIDKKADRPTEGEQTAPGG
jgi:lipopolysaccharide exporter